MLVLILVVVLSLAVASSLGNNDWSFTDAMVSYDFPSYLASRNATGDEGYNNFVFLSYVILFNNLIPLSMYVTMEGARFVYSRYIENDLEMYDAKTNVPAQVRTNSIIEDLGQIQYIFSDKTGTLTQNEMVFAKCSVAGLKYGREDTIEVKPKKKEKSDNEPLFYDPKLLTRMKAAHETANDIHEFLMCLMLCNTVVPHLSDTGEMCFQASSPDEEALVQAAFDLGYKLLARDGNTCLVEILGQKEAWEIVSVFEFDSDRKRMSVIARGPDMQYVIYCKGADNKIMAVVANEKQQGVQYVTVGHLQEYAACGLRTLCIAMKYLSADEAEEVLASYKSAALAVRNRQDKLNVVASAVEMDMHLLGATAIEDKLQEGVEECIESLRKAGINFWVLTGDKQETAISVGMSSRAIDDSMDVVILNEQHTPELLLKLEKLYVELVEEKVWGKESDSVPGVLLSGTQNFMKIILGNVWNSLSARYTKTCEKHRHRRRSLCNMENSPDGAHKDREMDDMSTASFRKSEHDNISSDEFVMDETAVEIEEEVEYALVIDGETLQLLLQDEIKYLFLAVARECRSVICCRCSPAQKAAVVKLVTEPKLMGAQGYLSLAIGDGANDVPMIQSASVGVGISGREGRQAVLSSDFSIAQFRFLKRLLFVHGNYSYKRISKLILFSFMKNVALSISNFWFAVQTRYSGLLMYFGILFTLYNALFTTIPIVFIGIYNQDVSTEALMRYPTLYKNGLLRRSFNWVNFFGWCSLGIWHAWVIFYVPFTADGYYRDYTSSVEKFKFGLPSLGLWADGMAAYTCLILASTLQVALLTSNWTVQNAAAVIGTVFFYFGFIWFLSTLFGWSGLDIYEAFTAFGVVRALFSEPWFWLVMLLAPITAVLPSYIYKACRALFTPEPYHLLREWERNHKGQDLAQPGGADEFHRLMMRRNTGYAFSKDKSDWNVDVGQPASTTESSIST